MITSFSIPFNQTSSETPPIQVAEYLQQEITNTPAIISYQKSNFAIDIAKDVFPEMHYLTPIQLKKHNRALSKLYKKTGIKIY
ncbi:MAG: hypothetical protein BKP49_07775 [Treponema sp. CETP13]|nr:MAG: hypothetical protein BKP49_07775 [Treponema sp. CETP13]